MLLRDNRHRSKHSEISNELLVCLELYDDIEQLARIPCRCNVDDEAMQTIANTSDDIDIDPGIFPRSSERNEKNPRVDCAELYIPLDMKVGSQSLEDLGEIIESKMKIRMTEELISCRSLT